MEPVKKVKLKHNDKVYEVWIETITPERAALYLKNLGKQRMVKENFVKFLVKTLQNGYFDDLNGDTIAFDIDGRLYDGQHRLRSVIDSGVSITTLCFGGISKDTCFGKDEGRPRKLKDLLQHMGEQYACELSASIAYLHKYKHSASAMGWQTIRADNRTSFHLLKRNPTLRHSVKWAVLISKEAPVMHLPKGLFAFVHYILHKIDRPGASRFLDVLTYNVDSPTPDCPAFLLRQRYQRHAESGRRRDRAGIIERLAWSIKAWNFFIQERHVRLRDLAWRIGEPFPEFRDVEGLPYTYEMAVKAK